MSARWPDWFGMIGVVLFLAAYALLQANRLRADRLTYQLMNAFGAIAVLTSLVFDFNLSAFVLEALWLVISIYGIVRGYRARRDAREAAR